MTTYTAYTRSGVSVFVSGIIYTIIGFAILGFLMDEFPAWEDLIVLSLFVIVLPICYLLAMLTSKSKLSIIFEKGGISMPVVRNSVSSPNIMAVMFANIRNIRMKNSILAGSYILLELEYGLRVKLYSKQFFFVKNSSFYDMFLTLNKAVESNEAIPRTHNTQLPEVETVLEGKPPISQFNPQIMSVGTNIKKPFVTISTRGDSLAARFPQAVYFKGNQFVCAVGIITWLMFLLFIMFSFLLGTVVENYIWLMPILMVAWALSARFFFYYVGLSQTHIEVRNHNVPWVKKIFNLNDIKEVVFESRGILANVITIVRKDFSYESYRCASIRPVQWIELKNALEKMHITVLDNNGR